MDFTWCAYLHQDCSHWCQRMASLCPASRLPPLVSLIHGMNFFMHSSLNMNLIEHLPDDNYNSSPIYKGKMNGTFCFHNNQQNSDMNRSVCSLGLFKHALLKHLRGFT
ncbi:hypothetical protein Pyn_08858 [Prunus yedoensis var. nudiflora]|uniref:Uncharacterized protein n=1 Tax=Prunus yedoensis var. nudiflora TaxID=2094558 RepID=A0A314ZEB5_PRUYE|nr:hypothetical protein Pyn_08858 [Prunus yedoensis var. nudiflora]